MIMTVFAGIAEFERDLIREGTGAGREAAKRRGVRFGRPRKVNADQRSSGVATPRARQSRPRHRQNVQRTRSNDLPVTVAPLQQIPKKSNRV
jgi:DNA invertase Pin-like site-specific DNA recombinase